MVNNAYIMSFQNNCCIHTYLLRRNNIYLRHKRHGKTLQTYFINIIVEGNTLLSCNGFHVIINTGTFDRKNNISIWIYDIYIKKMCQIERYGNQKGLMLGRSVHVTAEYLLTKDVFADVYIFNHQRKQALSVITSTLY